MTVKWITQRELILKRSQNGMALWDYDGAISTSEPIQTEAYRLLLDQHNVEAEDNLHQKFIYNKSTEETLVLLKDFYNLSPSVPMLVAEKNDIVDELISLTGSPTWFLTELVHHLTAQGTEIAILSNGKSGRIEKAWNRWGLEGNPAIYTPDTVKKFNKRDFEKNLIEQELAKIVFEGNPDNLKQAKKMEAFAVGVKNRSNQLTENAAHLLLDIQMRNF